MEVSSGVFNTYVALLAIAGVVTLVVACLPLRQGVLARVLGVAFGLGFLGYAFYLEFVFDGGTFTMFYYVFILPFVYIARVVKAYADRRKRQDALMQQQAAYGMPGAYPPPAPGQAYPTAYPTQPPAYPTQPPPPNQG